MDYSYFPGSDFEDIRKRIATVGDQLTAKQVADYLIVGMGHRLERLAEDAQKELEKDDKNRASGIGSFIN